MEPTRELDQIRSELDKLHDRTNATKTALSTLEALTAAQQHQIMTVLEAIQRDMDTMRDSISSLQSLATKGETSLKTFLWIGGTIAAITSFILMIYSYIPK